MSASSAGAAEQAPDSDPDFALVHSNVFSTTGEQLLLPHKLDENVKALEEYHLLQHDEFVKMVNKNADECEKLYAEIMGVVHKHVPRSLSGLGLQPTCDGNVMASRMVTKFAKVMNSAAKVCPCVFPPCAKLVA